MRVAALLKTHHLQEEVMPWMAEARDLFDQLVIFIDEKRSTPGTVSYAEKLSPHVHRYYSETWYGSDFASMARACDSDWVFLFDFDEEFGPEWHQKRWRQVLETTSATHFWIPRRWMVSRERYIISNPWCPDFQLRFFRNNLEGTLFPTKLHDSTIVPGPGACFQNLTVNHHVLWLSSRSEREEKVRLYDELRPGRGSGHYYLYEDHAPREANLPAPVELDPKREIRPMVRLSPEQMAGISLEVRSVPATAGVSGLFWVDVAVTNATSETIHSRPPLWPVHLSYHWLHQETRQMCVWDGYRNGFFPDAPANATTPCTMMIVAPDQPGQYLLQISIVQEEVCWFDQVRSGTLQEFAVSVIAGDGRAP